LDWCRTRLTRPLAAGSLQFSYLKTKGLHHMPTVSRCLSTGLFFATLLFSSLAPDTAAAQDRRVRIINGTNTIVNSFFASNTKRRSWEEDILGKSVLQPGQSVIVNIDDGSGSCMFDFRAVLVNGRRVEMFNVNVCQVSSWTIR
jgi:hypothetical protein